MKLQVRQYYRGDHSWRALRTRDFFSKEKKEKYSNVTSGSYFTDVSGGNFKKISSCRPNKSGSTEGECMG